MNKKNTVGILRKFLWFCGIGPIPAPLLEIARHTPFVAICGARAWKTRNPAPLLDLSAPQPRHRLFVAICGGSVAFREVIRAAASSSSRRYRRAMKKKSKSSCAPLAMRVIMSRFLAARFFRHAARGFAELKVAARRHGYTRSPPSRRRVSCARGVCRVSFSARPCRARAPFGDAGFFLHDVCAYCAFCGAPV